MLKQETLLEKTIQSARELLQKMQKLRMLDAQCKYLEHSEPIELFLKRYPFVQTYIQQASKEEKLILYVLIALHEADAIFQGADGLQDKLKHLEHFLNQLVDVEQFYKPIGGLLGYYIQVLELIVEQHQKRDLYHYSPPPLFDIKEKTTSVDECIQAGLQHMHELSEVYPVGGAGDRLNLLDQATKKPLPAACLQFLGRSLLEGLIRDLQAREYLYYKTFGKELITPIVLMTSEEKDNDLEITKILEEASYFGRSKSSFFQFRQPLTPVITLDGHFALKAPLQLHLKPGGHGVIWKLAKDKGALEWLSSHKRTSLLVRQINNPLAGVDYGLLAHTGYGFLHQKLFGFSSVPRRPNAQEGMNVLRRDGKKQAITNIEYTDLTRHAALDLSRFPANTNILFANIKAINRAVEILPLPGLLINTKLTVDSCHQGTIQTTPAVRLETTMQNIAEAFDAKDVYVTFNDRNKTISVTKRSFEGADCNDTPESALYDVLSASYDLLKTYCGVKVPAWSSLEEYLRQGPSLLFLYHPALGPLYSIIAKKLQGGTFAKNAELQLEIADVVIDNLNLDGSLCITAEQVMGKVDPKTHIHHFSDTIGSVRLHNVTVKNQGIDRSAKNIYWKNEIVRKEALTIILEGHSEFHASDVEFIGGMEISVPDKSRATATQNQDGTISIRLQPL